MCARARSAILAPQGLDALVGALRDRGYAVVGPTRRDGAIVYDELASADELPAGWTDAQDGGSYRLARRADEARFGYAVGPDSWKRWLFPPSVRLWSAQRDGAGALLVDEPDGEPPRLAFLGARACELHAIAVQDRVLLGGRFADRDYAARRERIFVVAVNCGEPGGTCFCASMGTGPKAEAGHDLVLTELLDGEHRFLVEAGSERGAEVLAALPAREPVAEDFRAATAVTARAAERMGRRLDTRGIRDLLLSSLEHPRWDDVAGRCLTCGNCTLVCPTCFCVAVEDATDLAGAAERRRTWDSCFSVAHTELHGGATRKSPRARYRQWLTHKLATWHDQFGTSGCVGCGRCITWCPVGIDITEEVAAIRAGEEGTDAHA